MKRKLERSSSTQGKKAKLQRTSTLELGRITGKVAPSSTTLSRAGGPFSGKKFVTFLYENALSKVSGGTNVVTVQVKPNDMYDYDNTGEAGNKQPLYYDALLSASGPYKTIQDNFMEDHVVFHESNRVSRGYIYISTIKRGQ